MKPRLLLNENMPMLVESPAVAQIAAQVRARLERVRDAVAAG